MAWLRAKTLTRDTRARRYTGRPSITVRADLAFGKVATISITVEELKGVLRFSLRKGLHPYVNVTHASNSGDLVAV